MRFDYVKYDKNSQYTSDRIREKVEEIERIMEIAEADGLSEGVSSRWHDLFLDNLEITFMCAGKYLRDVQVNRNSMEKYIE